MEVVHLNQKQLAARWHLSEACLERWRSEGIGPKFMKLKGRVRYRQVDIEPARVRGKRCDRARKNPNRERLGFQYWAGGDRTHAHKSSASRRILAKLALSDLPRYPH